MNYTISGHNNLIPNPVFSESQYAGCQNYMGKQCSGRECTKSAKNLLEIIFINKKGFFCDECTHELLAKKLAVSVQESDQS
jgi:hypothetical protein